MTKSEGNKKPTLLRRGFCDETGSDYFTTTFSVAIPFAVTMLSE
jgi:hypothetical protein